MPYKNPEDRKRTKAAIAYGKRPETLAKNRARNKARYEAEKAGKVSKGDGKDIDHIVPLSHGGSTGKENLRIVTQNENRSYDRTPSHAVARKRKSK